MTEKQSAGMINEINNAYIADNLRRIQEKISDAVARRDKSVCISENVRLMAVTKTVETEKICFACEHGVTLLGENRVQEMLEKCGGYPKTAEVHFIGGLQTNKVKYLAGKVSCIHSVDSERLLREIDLRFKGLQTDVLLEINVGGEAEKHGVSIDGGLSQLKELAAFANELKCVRLRGIMTIPPVCTGDLSMKYFSKTREIFDILKSEIIRGTTQFDTLSMGMSGDYEQAILCGATIVRVGTALFGGR